MNRYDYVIIGSGIGGLYTALLAQKQGSVLVITKGSIDECNTRHAQGGIAAAIGTNDSPELHFKDTMNAGAGLSDPEAVRILVNEAPDRIADLVRHGVPFDTLDGAIALTLEAAHSVPRVLHARGDATGAAIEDTLSTEVRSYRIQVLEYCLVTSLIVENGEVKGVKALDLRNGVTEEYQCGFLILATGGAGQLYKYNTNSEIATGDGVALAYDAGAEITDIEFYQFHPTALRLPGVPAFLISEAVRGEGGLLKNVEGQRFMPGYTPEAELAPRDVVARSILFEMRKTGSDRVFLDVTHLSPRQVTTRFPQIYKFCADHGLDITRGLIPVAPAAHYMMGGVRTNTWGETNIRNLFANGEVACTGVHGANRLASNSLLETLIFGKRIMERTGKSAETGKDGSQSKVNNVISTLSARQGVADVPEPNRSALQQLMWDKVSIVRNKEELTQAADILATWQRKLPKPTDRPTYELNNMIVTGRLVTEAALMREESRGSHYRSDLPRLSLDWQRHIIFTKK